jgi:hypothetical protein
MKMFKQLAGYPRAKGRSLSVFRAEAIAAPPSVNALREN